MRLRSCSAFLAPLLVALLVPAIASPARGPVVETGVRDALASAADATTYVIVMLRQVPPQPMHDHAALQEAVAELESAVLGRIPPGDFTRAYRFANFAGFTGRINAEGLAQLESDPDVISIGADLQGTAQLDVSVPFIGADHVQDDLGITGEGVTVAVLDTGIDTDHPDLSDDLAPGAWHFMAQGANTGPGAEDDNGHGTNVSGIITGRGVVASRGVAPDARILAVKVLDATSSGWLSDWAAGVDYVTSLAVGDASLRVINMSVGSFTLYTQCPCDAAATANTMLQTAIAAARSVGVVTFASSGNNGSTVSMTSPACVTSCVAVAAVYDQDLGPEPDTGTYQTLFGTGFGACSDATTFGDKIACFSNRSPCNELAAPGRRITAAGLGGGTSTYTGTSQAAPHVAATAALMHQRGGSALDPATLVSILKSTGVATVDPAGTAPNPLRINALAAVLATPVAVPALPIAALPLVMAALLATGAAAARWRTKRHTGKPGR